MRVSINKLTGKMIESQSGGETLSYHLPEWSNEEWGVKNEEYRQSQLDTLRQNAIRGGHLEKDIEVKFVTQGEYETLIEASKPEPTEAQLYEAAIKVKEAEWLRTKAIELIEAEKIEAVK